MQRHDGGAAAVCALCHKQAPSAADVVVDLFGDSFSCLCVLNIIYKCVHLSNPLDFFCVLGKFFFCAFSLQPVFGTEGLFSMSAFSDLVELSK